MKRLGRMHDQMQGARSKGVILLFNIYIRISGPAGLFFIGRDVPNFDGFFFG